MRFRRVRKRRHQWVVPQHLVDSRPLNPDPAAVNQPDLAKPGVMRGADVLVDDGWDIARRESVQVDRLFDWDAMHVC